MSAPAPAPTDPPTTLRHPIIHVTTHSSTTKQSTLASSAPAAFYTPLPGTQFATIHTTTLPPNFTDDTDLAAHAAVDATASGLVKSNGAVIRYVDFAPGVECAMHRTQSLDFGILVEGQVTILLDDGTEKPMQRGDVCVQRGTMHAWRNDGDQWARVVFVLLASEAIVVAGERMESGLLKRKGLEEWEEIKMETA